MTERVRRAKIQLLLASFILGTAIGMVVEDAHKLRRAISDEYWAMRPKMPTTPQVYPPMPVYLVDAPADGLHPHQHAEAGE